ncbi:MAG: twin-arginine translocase subunit TatC [Prosthecobacter sp.]|uniref:twin-arginine translocase subunit TatC n=1 Tax=Prosthecobacter sp. TaxID=1965333 RepID=UPI0025DCEE15|nr:twin-arginine translocase subunit TatC [Prosthecobacter sp.]MCF7787284.1 twin-arginine translocase subunit TatC [Prosthecobacter sp.]
MWSGILQKVFKVREKVAMNLSGKGDEEKPFLEHLEDLRTMIVRIVTTLIVSTIGTFVFYQELFIAILYPLVLAGFAKNVEEARSILINIDVAGPFMMAVNVSLIAAVIISFPLLLIFLLQFILPGLKPNEKKMIFPAIAIGTGLFLSGATFAYWVVLPKALQFFAEFAASVGAKQMWALNEYITFTTRFILVFGISFELPVIVMALVKLDILNYKIMKSTWRHALVAITLFAAIITPTPDVFTLMLMSGPLYVLYAICVWLAYTMEKKDRAAYPEYYSDIDKDAKELENSVGDDWDNENYNPWSAGDDDEDEKDDYQAPAAKPSAPPPDVENSDIEDHGEDQSSQMPEEDPSELPTREMTLEELAREDEKNSNEPPKDS